MFSKESEVCDPKNLNHCQTYSGSEGQDADIILYFTGGGVNGCSDVYGYSAYCHTNAYDRPIAGFVNLCEATLTNSKRIFTWEQEVTLIVHEVFHVLGFSSTGFAFYRFNDEHRSPRSKRDEKGQPFMSEIHLGYDYGLNTIQYHKIRGKMATMIVLPTVIEKAKEFYQCNEFCMQYNTYKNTLLLVSKV